MRANGIFFGLFLLAACGSEPASQQTTQSAAKKAEKAQTKPANQLASSEGKCPFSETSGWYAQIENNRFSIRGQVDLMMAGFKPALKKRASGGGEAAFDLSLEQAAGAAVDAAVNYEEPLSTPYRQVKIYCGGKEVAAFDTLDQRL